MSAARAYSVARPGSPATHKLRRPFGAAMFSKHAWDEIAHSLKLFRTGTTDRAGSV